MAKQPVTIDFDPDLLELLALIATTSSARSLSTANQNVRVTWSSLELWHPVSPP
jgi:hypothetical protein